jgi:ERCC4-type nuclease
MKQKSESFQKFKSFKQLMEATTNMMIKALRIDRRVETC